LARDILAALRVEHPRVYTRVKYVIAERSPAMERLQRERLVDCLDKVRWSGVTVDGYPGIQDVKGIVLSNELIDALPAHVVRSAGGGLKELYVTCEDRADSIWGGNHQAQNRPPPIAAHEVPASSMPGEFGYSWGPLSSARLDEYLRRMGAQLSAGQIVEINLDAIDWLQAVARPLSAGFLVTIDYGDIAQHLYGQDRRGGTLRAFHKHALAATVLERVGQQDITSSVNFTALMEYGRDAGLETLSFERQSAFLIRLGLIDRIAALETPADIVAGLKDRLAIKNLFVPGGSSDNFRVLIQRKKPY